MSLTHFHFYSSNYYPYSKSIKGLQDFAVGYRFSFNGQERDDEVAGVGNTMTAEFWEYDARLGRRWNIDPKPISSSISPYATFNNNPILFVDSGGDTTYVYNIRGQYMFTILDTKKDYEIVFVTTAQANRLQHYTGSYWTENRKADLARNPNFAYARITEQAITDLNGFGISKGQIEHGGLLTIDAKTKIGKPTLCKECEVEEKSEKGVLGRFSLKGISNPESFGNGRIFGMWHDHNTNDGLFGTTQPTFDNPKSEFDIRKYIDFNNASEFLPFGGIGIINTNTTITIYPLSNTRKGSDTSPPISFGGTDSSIMNKRYDESKHLESSYRYGIFKKGSLENGR